MEAETGPLDPLVHSVETRGDQPVLWAGRAALQCQASSAGPALPTEVGMWCEGNSRDTYSYFLREQIGACLESQLVQRLENDWMPGTALGLAAR